MISTLPGPIWLNGTPGGYPGSGHVGSWRLASMPTYVLGCGCAVVSGPETNRVLKVETNERDGKSHRTTVQVCEVLIQPARLADPC